MPIKTKGNKDEKLVGKISKYVVELGWRMTDAEIRKIIKMVDKERSLKGLYGFLLERDKK